MAFLLCSFLNNVQFPEKFDIFFVLLGMSIGVLGLIWIAISSNLEKGLFLLLVGCLFFFICCIDVYIVLLLSQLGVCLCYSCCCLSFSADSPIRFHVPLLIVVSQWGLYLLKVGSSVFGDFSCPG